MTKIAKAKKRRSLALATATKADRESYNMPLEFVLLIGGTDVLLIGGTDELELGEVLPINLHKGKARKRLTLALASERSNG